MIPMNGSHPRSLRHARAFAWRAARLLSAAAALLWIGCGGDTAAPSSDSASQKNSPSRTAQPTDAAPPPELTAMFVDEPGVGADPFFPNARAVAATDGEPAPEPRINPALMVEVKAIFGSSRAKINDQWFSPGQEREIELADGRLLAVQVISIQPDSVVVEIPSLSRRETLFPAGRGR